MTDAGRLGGVEHTRSRGPLRMRDPDRHLILVGQASRVSSNSWPSGGSPRAGAGWRSSAEDGPWQRLKHAIDVDVVRTLNRSSAAAPRWPELEVVDGAYSMSEHTRSHIVSRARAGIAETQYASSAAPSATTFAPATVLVACSSSSRTIHDRNGARPHAQTAHAPHATTADTTTSRRQPPATTADIGLPDTAPGTTSLVRSIRLLARMPLSGASRSRL